MISSYLLTDDVLIEQIALGNKQAFNELYLRYHKKIFGLCFHFMQQIQDAEEVMQDVFVVVHKTAHKFHHKASCSTWLYRIAVNKCLDALRYKNARKRFAFITHFFEDKPMDSAAPYYSDHQTSELYQAIKKLPEQQKTAIILTQIQELNFKETASIMDTTLKAVESLVQRAKANLKKNLKKSEE